jgi:phosphoketolase
MVNRKLNVIRVDLPLDANTLRNVADHSQAQFVDMDSAVMPPHSYWHRAQQ